MDYFVDIENTPYYHWQIELLIESFEHHQLSKDLVISLIQSENSQSYLCRKLFKHPRLNNHFNMGQIRGFNRLNKQYSMVDLLKANLLKQPFIAIEPDCVLHSPVVIEALDVPHVVFQAQPSFTFESAEEHIPNIKNYLSKEEWIPLGSIMYFNNLPMEVFERTIVLTEMLAYEQVKVGGKIWQATDRVGWVINLLALQNQCRLHGEYTLEMNLTDNYEHNFISYERPVLPHFSKTLFKYSSEEHISFGDPFDSFIELSQQIGTSASRYVANLVEKYLDSIARKV